jgi:hypothetical protein
MRYLVLIAFWFLGSTAQAQHLSAGLRASGNFSLQRAGAGSKMALKPLQGAKPSVAPEAFLRYQGRKCWAAEFAVTTDRMQQQYWWAGTEQASGLNRSTFNTRSVEAAINLQYEIRCHRMASIQSLKNLHSYIGLGTSLGMMQQQAVLLTPAGESATKNSEYWYHWISLSKTLRYDVNRHFSVQTDGQCGMNTSTMFRNASTPEAALRFSLKLGATYNW